VTSGDDDPCICLGEQVSGERSAGCAVAAEEENIHHDLDSIVIYKCSDASIVPGGGESSEIEHMEIPFKSLAHGRKFTQLFLNLRILCATTKWKVNGVIHRR
jgi:hypothetical protein